MGQITVQASIGEVFEQITSDDFLDEFERRLKYNDFFCGYILRRNLIEKIEKGIGGEN